VIGVKATGSLESVTAGDEVKTDDSDDDDADERDPGGVAGSSNRTIPSEAVPTAPIPVQTA